MSESTPSSSSRELVLVRDVPVSPEKLFRAWHTRLPEWWAPKPLTTTVREFDFRPGGAFSSVMRDPSGQEYPGDGVFLEIVENRRIVFTDAYKAGWEPNPEFFFTAVITFDPLPDGGTRYTARALHWTEESRRKYAEMGFETGWSQVLNQLADLAANT